ncbi:hypothetical protein N9N67_00750 [Bacteriovoracaceae bacterium]|nr:hypothetical protein [Bacteriovoracaceae bacterium]
MINNKFLIIFYLLTFSLFANEGNLRFPMAFENANVLPKGIRNVQIRNGQYVARDKYDNDGNVQNLGAPLNKDVKFLDFVDAQETEFKKGQLQGALKAGGVSENDIAGETTGQVQIDIDAQVPIFAYGVTEKWTTAFAIPIVTTKVDIKTGFKSSGTSDSFVSQEFVSKGLRNKAYEMQSKTDQAIKRKLRRYDYDDDLEDREETRLGDIVLVNKYNVIKNKKSVLTLRGDLVLPTGETTDVDRAVDVGSGDGQMDIGIGGAYTYFLNDTFSLTTFLSYTNQMAAYGVDRRIPEKASTKVTPDIDRNTRVDLGDQYIGQIYLSAKIGETPFTLMGGFHAALKEEDRYSGDKYSSRRYNYLNRDTDQEMHATLAGMTFSTVGMFRRGEFKVPLQISLMGTNVYRGRNAIKDNLTSFEFSLFF